jgi:hypothetical protein
LNSSSGLNRTVLYVYLNSNDWNTRFICLKLLFLCLKQVTRRGESACLQDIVSLQHKAFKQFSCLRQHSVIRTRMYMSTMISKASFPSMRWVRTPAAVHEPVINSNGRQGQSHLARLVLGQLWDGLPCLMTKKGRICCHAGSIQTAETDSYSLSWRSVTMRAYVVDTANSGCGRETGRANWKESDFLAGPCATHNKFFSLEQNLRSAWPLR